MYARKNNSSLLLLFITCFLKRKSTGVGPLCLDHGHACLQKDAVFWALAYTGLDDGGRKQRCAAIGFEIISILVMYSPWTGM